MAAHHHPVPSRPGSCCCHTNACRITEHVGQARHRSDVASKRGTCALGALLVLVEFGRIVTVGLDLNLYEDRAKLFNLTCIHDDVVSTFDWVAVSLPSARYRGWVRTIARWA